MGCYIHHYSFTLAAEGSNNVLLLPNKRKLMTVYHIMVLALIRSHFSNFERFTWFL